jgi:hypothetical protein
MTTEMLALSIFPAMLVVAALDGLTGFNVHDLGKIAYSLIIPVAGYILSYVFWSLFL